MNPVACRLLNYGDLVEIFAEDADMMSTTSDARDTRHPTENEPNASRGTEDIGVIETYEN